MDTPRNLPRINEPAPEFNAVTTHGQKKLRTTRAAGWSCSRTRRTSRRSARPSSSASRSATKNFQKRNTDILGVSIDSIFSHLAWVQNIKEKMGVSVPFPLIADLDMKVASAYGMVHPEPAIPRRCAACLSSMTRA